MLDFEPIPLDNMPPLIEKEEELSVDAKYLLQMGHAVSQGFCSADLANKKPGQVVHSRWLTKASRILRLYVATNNPSYNLKTLAIYIMTVYIPLYFNIKYYKSVIYGSVLLSKFIRWTQYLNDTLRPVVQNVVLTNSYYAHSENVLLSMLFDDRKPIRDRAIRKIMYIREKIYDPNVLRKYVKPKNINFNCIDYINMIDLNDDSILHEPPFTRKVPFEHLTEYLDCDNEDTPFEDPKIACHIQGTERCVQLLTSVSKRTIHEHREEIMNVTTESREVLPRMESKTDFAKFVNRK